MTASENGNQVPISPARSERYEQTISGDFESLVSHIPNEVAATKEPQVPAKPLPKQEPSKNRQNPRNESQREAKQPEPKKVENKRMVTK